MYKCKILDCANIGVNVCYSLFTKCIFICLFARLARAQALALWHLLLHHNCKRNSFQAPLYFSECSALLIYLAVPWGKLDRQSTGLASRFQTMKYTRRLFLVTALWWISSTRWDITHNLFLTTIMCSMVELILFSINYLFSALLLLVDASSRPMPLSSVTCSCSTMFR